MEIISTTDTLREQLSDWRHAGEHIALVPTKGNLHRGHMALVEIAREHAERVVVSIFVDPGEARDDDEAGKPPRTLERDKRRLQRVNADLIFLPDLETMYPFGVDNATSVTVPALTDALSDGFQPDHFDGVTTVVSRLFSLVQPDVAVFGEKDFQQQLVIRRLVADLSLPIEVVTGPTVREDDGLAKSCRNQDLDEDERGSAPRLYAVLQEVADGLAAGKRNYEELEAAAVQQLESAGFEPQYVSVRRAENLDAPNRDSDELVVLGAASIGGTRLIDCVTVVI